MKTYNNRLYSIEGAAKRAGISDVDIIKMIQDNVIGIVSKFGVAMISGKLIPKLERKNELYKDSIAETAAYDELTDEEKEGIKGDYLAHVKMVEGDDNDYDY